MLLRLCLISDLWEITSELSLASSKLSLLPALVCFVSFKGSFLLDSSGALREGSVENGLAHSYVTLDGIPGFKAVY